MDLQYTIQYKKGAHNAAADALSRCEHNQEVQAVYECVPTWVQRLQEGYEHDDHAKQLLIELAVAPAGNTYFILHNGVLRFKGRVRVGNNKIAQKPHIDCLA
jgi:predicted dienelactone hydrolase